MELKFNINGQHITREDYNAVVSDSVGYISCRFAFSDDWANVVKTAVFKKDDTVYNVVLVNDGIAEERMPVFSSGKWEISVFGGSLITSDSVEINVKRSGYSEGDVPEAPSQSVYETLTQLISESDEKAEEASSIASEIKEMAISGDFDGENGKSAYDIAVENGFSGSESEWIASLKGENGASGNDGQDGVSPEINISAVSDGHTVTITDKTHPQGQSFTVSNGQDGTNGVDGVSPAVSITNITNGHRVTITDKTHPSGQSMDLLNGASGNDGQDGVSPEINISAVSDGHTVTITDKTHPQGQSFTVSNGQDGTNGVDGVSPAVSITNITNGHRVTITDKTHPSGQTFDVTNGVNGTNGTTATISVGTVTTGSAGSQASVTNSGTSSAAVLDFVIPRGDSGSVTVDTAISSQSSNPVTNSAIAAALAAKSGKIIVHQNKQVLGTYWHHDSETYPDYPYRYPIGMSGVSPSTIPIVIFAPEQANSGKFAPVAESGEVSVTIFSKVDGEEFVVPTIILIPTE